jgi:hypothetical protein
VSSMRPRHYNGSGGETTVSASINPAVPRDFSCSFNVTVRPLPCSEALGVSTSSSNAVMTRAGGETAA